jgi:cytochrome c
MPLMQYRMIHHDKSITESDQTAIDRWAQSSAALNPSATGQLTNRGDPDRGRSVFEKRCTGCHSLTQDREGPKLRGVFGRISGTVPGFDYSIALRQAHIVWGDSSLDQWLTDPDIMVPGNNMEFRVPREDERRNLISFLKQGAGG